MLSTKNILYLLHINDNMDGIERFDHTSFLEVEQPLPHYTHRNLISLYHPSQSRYKYNY